MLQQWRALATLCSIDQLEIRTSDLPLQRRMRYRLTHWLVTVLPDMFYFRAFGGLSIDILCSAGFSVDVHSQVR